MTAQVASPNLTRQPAAAASEIQAVGAKQDMGTGRPENTDCNSSSHEYTATAKHGGARPRAKSLCATLLNSKDLWVFVSTAEIWIFMII